MSTSFIARKKNRVKEELRRVQVKYALSAGNKPVVKVYGLLRTGTNYLTRLLDLNFDVFCLNSVEQGWKHGPCDVDKRLNYIFAVKDPYSWLVSFMEWEIIHHRFSGNSISEFLRTPITQPELKAAWSNDDVISAWSLSLASWKTFPDESKAVYVRYEDIATSLDSELDKIGKKLGLKQTTAEFQNLKSRADSWETPMPRKQRHKDYYNEAHYLEQFTDEDFALIREKIDSQLVDAYGYKLL